MYFYAWCKLEKKQDMEITESGKKLHDLIVNAIADQRITRPEYDAIINMATEDGIIDSHERILLDQLQEMINNKTVKLVLE